MAPIINRTTRNHFARGGESVIELQLQKELERLDARLQEELEERFKGEFGLSSHKPSPPVGEGWGLLPENFGEEEKEIDPSSPMAIAFAKAMARKS